MANSQSKASFETSNMNCTVGDYFESIVSSCSEKIAIQCDQVHWSYAELNQRANVIARALLKQGGQVNGQVAVFCENIAWQIAAMLAILKTGQTIIMLDTALPDERLRFILIDAQVHTLLVDTALVERAPALTPIDSPLALIHVDNLPLDGSCLTLARPIDKHDLLAIIYTSGSTGTPKGVTRTHLAQMHNVWRYYQRSDFHPYPRSAIISSLAYAATFGLVLRMLLCGGCVCTFDLKRYGIQPFAQWLDREQITFMIPAISFLRQWCNTLEQPIHLRHLQGIEFVGAMVNKADLLQLRAKVIGNYTIALVYGSTEVLNVTTYLVRDVAELPAGPLPAGYDSPDKRIVILDEQGSPVARGQIGEVAVQSQYLSQGYWRNSTLTQEKFISDVHNPVRQLFRTGDLGYQEPDGCLQVKGRKDLMVKVRGYQVNLTEVEQSIVAMPEIQNAGVVTHEVDLPFSELPGQAIHEKELIAYIVYQPGCKLSQRELRQNLGKHLPAYMLPDRFVQVDTLPLTPTGKVDRQALSSPQSSKERQQVIRETPYQPPRTPLEKMLAGMWEEVLGLQPIGIRDHFLDLGGNSLRAMQIHARLLNQIRSDLPADLLFECATIADMALFIIQQLATQVEQTELTKFLNRLEAGVTQG